MACLGLPLRDRARSSDIRRDPRRLLRIEPLLLLCCKETDEAIQDASRKSSYEGISGISNWEKT